MTTAFPRFFEFHSITVLTTDKCTAKCAHCCVSSSPTRKTKMDFAQIKASLEPLLETHPIKVVVFAGGEPSLLKNDLVKAISFCAERGIQTRVVTNASWAIDARRTLAMLTRWRDAGLTDLNISADDYHLPFIPLDRLKRVWAAAKGLGFNAVIVALAYQKGSRVEYAQLCDLFEQPDIPLVYDEDGHAKELDALRHADGTLYAICRRPSSRSGRGAQMIAAEDIAFVGGRNEYSTCPWLRTSPAISSRGELVSCCGFEVRKVKELNFGPVDDQVHARLDALSDDVLLHALSQVGPKRLLEFVRTKPGAKVSFDRHVSMCEACEDLTSKPENIRILRENAAEIAAWTIARSRKRQKSGAKKVAAE